MKFQELEAQAREKGMLAPDDAPQLQRLRAIARKLIPHAQRWNQSAAKWQWEINLIRLKQVNAFCMPGGKIAFFSGILDTLKLTDDEAAWQLSPHPQQPGKAGVANVSGTGLINAAGNVGQSLTGNLTGGTTATPTMAFGNVHVGDSPTRNYQVNNTGTTGPVLRGALQTSANGGNMTDSRLSGSGVTPGNFGPLSLGGSTSNLAVVFNATAAGALERSGRPGAALTATSKARD